MGVLAINGGVPVRTEPFPQWPLFDESEIEALKKVLASRVWGINSPVIAEFEERFASYHDCKYGLACANGTVTLEVALKASGVGPGDEVIVPPYTFIATASSVIASNAVPIFVDIDPETYCIAPDQIEKNITDKTKAIIPVHMGGYPADMDRIMAIAAKHNLVVIEDAAHAHGGEYNGRGIGSLGHIGSFSFQTTKNMSSGEGGILISNDKELIDRCFSFQNCGRVREGAWYEHPVIGSNYRLSAFQAAILLCQFERLEEQTNLRWKNAKFLDRLLSDIEGIDIIPADEKVTKRAYHIYIFKYDKSAFGNAPKKKFIESMKKEGIPCLEGYVPLYKEKGFWALQDKCPIDCKHYGKKVDYSKLHLPVCERVHKEESIWLLHPVLLGTEDDMLDIANAIKKIQSNCKELT